MIEEAGGGELGWYGRPEGVGWWRISACREHGEVLLGHRFIRLGERTEFSGVGVRTASTCSPCEKPELLMEVEHCTCELDAARCSVHQNIGCGG